MLICKVGVIDKKDGLDNLQDQWAKLLSISRWQKQNIKPSEVPFKAQGSMGACRWHTHEVGPNYRQTAV